MSFGRKRGGFWLRERDSGGLKTLKPWSLLRWLNYGETPKLWSSSQLVSDEMLLLIVWSLNYFSHMIGLITENLMASSITERQWQRRAYTVEVPKESLLPEVEVGWDWRSEITKMSYADAEQGQGEGGEMRMEEEENRIERTNWHWEWRPVAVDRN